MWLNIKLRESFCSPAARLVHGAHKSCPLGRAQRMQKYLLQQPKQWSCSETGCQLMFLLEWSCPPSLAAASKRKRKKKRHSTSRRSPNYVTGSALLADIMWDALFSKFLHLTSKNCVYFMDHKRDIFFPDCQPWAHSLVPSSHSPSWGAWAVNDLSSPNLHIPLT